MVHLSTQNSNDLKEIFADMTLATDEKMLRSRIVSQVHRAFGSSSTIFWMINEDRQLVEPVFKGIQDQYLMPYKDYFFRQNPFDPGNLPVLNQPSVLMEQLLPIHTFHRTEYYNDFIKPQNIQRQMAVYIRQKGELKAVIGMHRTVTKSFGPHFLFMGDMISQWLTSAFERLALHHEVNRAKSIFHMIIENDAAGLLLFDDSMECIFSNRPAETICLRIGRHQGPVLSFSNPALKIPGFLIDGCRQMKTGSLPVKIHTVSISAHEKYQVKWQAVDAGISNDIGSGYMVSLTRIQVLSGLDNDRLKDRYGLTPREIEIVTYICKGLSNIEIADTLFISEGTVKNHLKHIFAKMEASNRTRVVHKALFSQSE